MGQHYASTSTRTPMGRYQRSVEELLDEYKQGQISREQALSGWEEQMTIITQHFRAGFEVRLANLQAFRVRRGESVLPGLPAGEVDG